MILNKTMNEIADAIREKKGTSELIAPVDFATEIKGITAGGGSGGGGADLEGEYFLAKPNGRYWKFTFSPDGYYIDPNSLSAEQLEALQIFCAMFGPLGVAYGAAVCYENAPADSFLRADGVVELSAKIGVMSYMLDGSTGIDTYYFNSNFPKIWKECSVKTSTVTVTAPFHEYDVVSFLKQMASMEGMEITDEQIMMMLESQFMLIPATEEEYKAARREN